MGHAHWEKRKRSKFSSTKTADKQAFFNEFEDRFESGPIHC